MFRGVTSSSSPTPTLIPTRPRPESMASPYPSRETGDAAMPRPYSANEVGRVRELSKGADRKEDVDEIEG